MNQCLKNPALLRFAETTVQRSYKSSRKKVNNNEKSHFGSLVGCIDRYRTARPWSGETWTVIGTAVSNIFTSTISSFGAAGAGFTDGMAIGLVGGGSWVPHGTGILPRSILIQTPMFLR